MHIGRWPTQRSLSWLDALVVVVAVGYLRAEKQKLE
jgi:hypothetical protein